MLKPSEDRSIDQAKRSAVKRGKPKLMILIEEKLMEGKEAIIQGDLDRTLSTLIEAVMIDKSYCDELPRKSVIALFNLLGPDHDLTKKYRRRFDMALY